MCPILGFHISGGYVVLKTASSQKFSGELFDPEVSRHASRQLPSGDDVKDWAVSIDSSDCPIVGIVLTKSILLYGAEGTKSQHVSGRLGFW